MKTKLLFVLFLLGIIPGLRANVLYVDSSNVNGFQDGASWVTAFTSPQAAINMANAGDSVWIAKGTYNTALNTPFAMKEGVRVYGGFMNTFTAFAQRNWIDNPTIFKRNGGYAVIHNNNNSLTVNAVLDGFIIQGGGLGDASGINNYYASPTIINCTFKSHTSSGIVNNYCSPNISYCTFADNLGSSGAGIQNRNGSAPVIDHCIFTNNEAYYFGGAIDNTLGSSPAITYCIFTGNRARAASGSLSYSWGGAICNNQATPATIDNCTFNGNISGYSYPNGYGGAIYNRDASTSITNCTFVNNEARGGGGNAIYNSTSSPYITNCTLNDTVYSGNDIINSGSSPILSSCNFIGVKGYGMSNLAGSAPVLTACNFLDCRGGMNSDNSAPVLSYVTFSNSVLSAMRNTTNSAPVLKGCSFLNNTSANYGGAMYNVSSTPKLTNCVFAGNTSTLEGGAIYNNGSSPVVTNCTFIKNNSASAGVIRNTNNSQARVANSIIWGNGSVVANDVNSSMIVSYSLVQGFPASSVYHNIAGTTDPLFVDTANGNYKLQSTSPCIDAGQNDSIPAGIVTDRENNTRIAGIAVDLGAYEFAGTPLTLGLTTFTAALQQDGRVALLWRTELETGINHFELQRSNDGHEFAVIARITAKDGGFDAYDYADADPLPVNYYRLLMVTKDGRSSYSSIIRVDKQSRVPVCSIYPNPAKEHVLLHADASLLSTKAMLMSADGRMLKSFIINSTNQYLSLSGLDTGMFLLKLENGTVIKIVKE